MDIPLVDATLRKEAFKRIQNLERRIGELLGELDSITDKYQDQIDGLDEQRQVALQKFADNSRDRLTVALGVARRSLQRCEKCRCCSPDDVTIDCPCKQDQKRILAALDTYDKEMNE